MSDGQRRRSPRYKAALPVALLDSKSGQTDFSTVDVSRGGVFVQAEVPRPLRQLVRLRIAIPGAAPVDVHGMVVHVVTREDAASRGAAPGMGIEFFGFGGDPRQRWEDFLRGLQSGVFEALTSSAPELPVAGPERAAPAAPLGSQRSPAPPHAFGGQRSPASAGQRAAVPARANVVCRVFPVPVPAAEHLYELYERELVSGSMFLCTTVRVPVGDRVVLRVIHPGNKRSFDLHALVRSVSADPSYPGLDLALRPSTLARREEFKTFVDSGIPETDLSFELED